MEIQNRLNFNFKIFSVSYLNKRKTLFIIKLNEKQNISAIKTINQAIPLSINKIVLKLELGEHSLYDVEVKVMGKRLLIKNLPNKYIDF